MNINWDLISKSVKFIIIEGDGTEYLLNKRPIEKKGKWFFNKSSIIGFSFYKHEVTNIDQMMLERP